MITIYFNDAPIRIPENYSLPELLQEKQWHGCFAVALNKTFLPRARYDAVQLKEGDRINVVAPMQGG